MQTSARLGSTCASAAEFVNFISNTNQPWPSWWSFLISTGLIYSSTNLLNSTRKIPPMPPSCSRRFKISLLMKFYQFAEIVSGIAWSRNWYTSRISITKPPKDLPKLKIWRTSILSINCPAFNRWKGMRRNWRQREMNCLSTTWKTQLSRQNSWKKTSWLALAGNTKKTKRRRRHTRQCKL